jgi:hypothetical protein
MAAASCLQRYLPEPVFWTKRASNGQFAFYRDSPRPRPDGRTMPANDVTLADLNNP